MYGFFWLIRAARQAETRLKSSEREQFWFLLIPVVGLGAYFHGISKIERRVRASNVAPPIPFVLQAGTSGIVSALWRLHDPYWTVSLLSGILIATIHVSLTRAEAADGMIATNRLSWWEIAILVPGSILVVLGLIGTGVDLAPTGQVFLASVALAMIASIVVFFLVGRMARGR